LQKLLRDQPSLDRLVYTESLGFRGGWRRQRWFCGFCGHFRLPRGPGGPAASRHCLPCWSRDGGLIPWGRGAERSRPPPVRPLYPARDRDLPLIGELWRLRVAFPPDLLTDW